MTFEDFMKDFEFYKSEHKSLRDGQCLMNILYEHNQELYEYIEGTEYDCFYDSSKFQETLTFLKENWQ